MFTLDCVVGGLIVASTIFALFGPSGPDVTLPDTGRQTERMYRSQPQISNDKAGVENKREARVSRSI